jgi:hypothetical protein
VNPYIFSVDCMQHSGIEGSYQTEDQWSEYQAVFFILFILLCLFLFCRTYCDMSSLGSISIVTRQVLLRDNEFVPLL